MAIFDETYRVVDVESQRLILRGLDSGEVLTVINANPETPITEEEYPLGKIVRLTDPQLRLRIENNNPPQSYCCSASEA